MKTTINPPLLSPPAAGLLVTDSCALMHLDEPDADTPRADDGEAAGVDPVERGPVGALAAGLVTTAAGVVVNGDVATPGVDRGDEAGPLLPLDVQELSPTATMSKHPPLSTLRTNIRIASPHPIRHCTRA